MSTSSDVLPMIKSPAGTNTISTPSTPKRDGGKRLSSVGVWVEVGVADGVRDGDGDGVAVDVPFFDVGRVSEGEATSLFSVGADGTLLVTTTVITTSAISVEALVVAKDIGAGSELFSTTHPMPPPASIRNMTNNISRIGGGGGGGGGKTCG